LVREAVCTVIVVAKIIRLMAFSPFLLRRFDCIDPEDRPAKKIWKISAAVLGPFVKDLLSFSLTFIFPGRQRID